MKAISQEGSIVFRTDEQGITDDGVDDGREDQIPEWRSRVRHAVRDFVKTRAIHC
jgi:hypothetical protein